MTRPIGSIVSAVFTTLLLAFGGAMLPDAAASAADDCIAAPKSPAPQGSHWYFRTDRQTQRKCWFLAPQGTNGVRSAPQAAPQIQPAAATPAPANETRADSTVMPPMPAEQPAPQPPSATMPRDMWQAAADALQRHDPPQPVEVDDRDATLLNLATVPATPEADAPKNDVRNEVPAVPPVVAAIQSQDPTTIPWRSIGFIAGALAGAALFLTLILKIAASERRQKLAERREAEPNDLVSLKFAPSIFDIRDVPPMPPIGRAEQQIDAGQLLRKLLRDVEGRAAGKAFARHR